MCMCQHHKNDTFINIISMCFERTGGKSLNVKQLDGLVRSFIHSSVLNRPTYNK